jgi:long-chain acyl-CoA synthetase
MQGYYNNPEATARVLSPDGWLRTGDLGFLDAEGYLYVTGRLKDVIILGGENVIPADIEEIVDHVPGVRHSAAVGVRGSHRHPAATCGGRGPRAGGRHRRSLAPRSDRLAHPRGTVTPARYSWSAQHHPKTSSGKIQRSRLGR